MTLVEFLNARLDEAEAGWETQRWGEANGCLKPVFHFGRSLAEEILADIAVKREIIRRSHLYARDLLLLLASVHSGHPDYNPEWAVLAGEQEQAGVVPCPGTQRARSTPRERDGARKPNDGGSTR